VAVGPGFLPYREARDKGPSDVIPATAFWLARLRAEDAPDPAAWGAHLILVLSGEVAVAGRGGEPVQLGPGDMACVDVRSSDAIEWSWPAEAWFLFVRTPGWLPEPGDNGARPDPTRRAGRPLITWIRDDNGSSRSEPLRWPVSMVPIPPVDSWLASRGAFVTRRDYGDGAYAAGVWHNGPRPQLGITLNGCAENETGDGTVTRPSAGDVAFIDDVTGAGHDTRGQGDRWMLFVTVAPGQLVLQPEG
jgi:hypothetical protein